MVHKYKGSKNEFAKRQEWFPKQMKAKRFDGATDLASLLAKGKPTQTELENLFYTIQDSGNVPSLHHFNLLLEIHQKNNNLDKITEYLDLMKSLGVQPDGFTFKMMVKATVPHNPLLWSHWLDEMQRLNVQPDIVIYSTIYETLNAKNHQQVALFELRMFKDLAKRQHDSTD